MLIIVPVKTERTVINVNQLNESDPYYDKLAKEIQNTIQENSEHPVFSDKAYILCVHNLLGNEKTVLSVPYMVSDIKDVGTAGTTQWTIQIKLLTLAWGQNEQNRLGKASVYSCKCTIKADPNTSLNSRLNNGNFMEVELNDRNREDTGGYALNIGAAANNSAIQPNTKCSVSIHWEGKMALSLGVVTSKSLRFEVSASAEYINNLINRDS